MEIADKLARWIIDQELHHKRASQLQEVQHHKALDDEIVNSSKFYRMINNDKTI